MSTATINPLSAAAPLYRPETGWPPLRACLMTILVLGVAAILGLTFFLGIGSLVDPARNWFEDDAAMPQWVMLAGQLVMQTASVLLIWWVAGWFRSDRRAALALRPVPGGASTIAKAFLLLSVISGAFTIFALTFASEDILSDLAPMWPLMKGEFWWLMALVAVIGAPLSEEIVFRGFLQSALAKSPLGFWGAAIITNSAWTALHAGYTTTGLTDVFIAGLVFTWALWRTGSLWVPIICHGLYNGLIFAVLSVMDMPEGLPGLPA